MTQWGGSELSRGPLDDVQEHGAEHSLDVVIALVARGAGQVVHEDVEHELVVTRVPGAPLARVVFDQLRAEERAPRYSKALTLFPREGTDSRFWKNRFSEETGF